MTTRYRSKDQHWQVSVISLDGRQRIRIEHDTPHVPGIGVPVHDGVTRCGPQYTAFGVWVADVDEVAQVESYVRLGDLTQANP